MFEINECLRQDVLSQIPEDAPVLLGCIMIYNQLCHKLNYSVEYFFKHQQMAPFYQDPSHLKLIDGKTRTDVNCYTFTAIMAEIVSKKYPEVGILPKRGLNEQEFFKDEHQFLTLTIDDVDYSFDAVTGVLQGNDLVNLKFCGRKIRGVYIDYILPCSEQEKQEIYANFYRCLDRVNSQNDKDLKLLSIEYLNQKQEHFKRLGLQERFDLFLKMLDQVPDVSITSLNYLIALKSALFTDEETHMLDEGHTQYLQMYFVFDENTRQPRVLFLFNPTGVTKTENNFSQDLSKLKLFDFSLKNKRLEQISLKELQRKTQTGIYTAPYNAQIFVTDGWIRGTQY